EWDQETYMPPGAAEARAHQVATLRRLAHERFTDEAVGAWLDRAEADTEADEALLRVTRRDYARATLLPSGWVAAFATAKGHAMEAWKKARETAPPGSRPGQAFAHFAPHLQRILDLSVEKAERTMPLLQDERGADYAPGDDARYDALLDEYEPGATTAQVAAVFADLRAELVPLVEAIAARPQLDDAVVHGPFPEDAQWAFGLEVAQAFGYDQIGRASWRERE